jgi:hypothetical protein
MSFSTSEQILEQRLAEIEETIRTMPPRTSIFLYDSQETSAWLGRACAAIENWNSSKGILYARTYVDDMMKLNSYDAERGLARLTFLLNQARHDLLAQLPGAGSVAVARGMVFEYFEEIRKIIQMARQDLLFVDLYLLSPA